MKWLCSKQNTLEAVDRILHRVCLVGLENRGWRQLEGTRLAPLDLKSTKVPYSVTSSFFNSSYRLYDHLHYYNWNGPVQNKNAESLV